VTVVGGSDDGPVAVGGPDVARWGWGRSLRGAEYLGCWKTISARQLALRPPAVLRAYLGPADWDVQHQRARVGVPLPSGSEGGGSSG
jgi:hypothetical protein